MEGPKVEKRAAWRDVDSDETKWNSDSGRLGLLRCGCKGDDHTDGGSRAA